MEKRAPPSVLGVRRRHKPKRLLRKLVSYLKSDSYMFAPLISSSTSTSSKRKYGLSPRKGSRVNAAGFEIGAENDGREKKRRLVEMIREYLRSDSYLYAPLVDGECFGAARKEITDPSSQGAPCLTKRITTSTASTVLMRKTDHRPIEESRDVIAEGQTEVFFGTNHDSRNASNQSPKQGEIVKQVVFPNSWPPILSVGDFSDEGSIAERVVHRRKIHGL
uniref:Uncharacterized protein n=1 Tax=Kalanchoe fedtschenkoi TaxID=63787 RepID=A0A7N0TY45_KALFE